MKAKDKLIERIINGFRTNKGKTYAYCYTKTIIPEIVYTVIIKLTTKHKDASILIVVDSYNTRKSILNYLKKNNMDLTNNIKCISVDYIKEQYFYKNTLNIIIGVNNNDFIINKLATEGKFSLCLLTENNMNTNFTISINKFLHKIDTADLDMAIKRASVYSPVEEHRFGVDMSDSDIELYDKYSDYINTSISIFGELSNIEKCKKGDNNLNISATEFRNAIAKENGWREDLDTSIPFMKQIDDIYNPNVLFDRACNFYNIAKLRRDLVCDNNAKLEIIKEICLKHKDKKILIISKRGEYASKITQFLNQTKELRCGDYHDCIDDAIATDNNGDPILIKSGENKGKPRIVGSQFQSTANEKLFNEGVINILSIKSSSNVKLKIACDLVIFTSSLCDNIIDVKLRFTNIVFSSEITLTYRVYCNNTIENDKLNKETNNMIFTIINETESNIIFDENSGNIIL